jgi:glyoxylase-like metal-dependent hydrolase (beta-lactamase superfamily II)
LRHAGEHATLEAAGDHGGMRVHVFETGRLVANATFLRGAGFSSLLRRVEPVDFPALAYVIEHPEGLMAVDTGLGAHIPAPRTFRGFPPTPETSADRELGPLMRERGLDPQDVRRVILTHLDWDHTGGLHHVEGAEVLVHRAEIAFGRTRMGRLRYRPSVWPAAFEPKVYDLAPEPYGVFPSSLTVTDAGDVRVVPLPGHSPGQVGVVVEDGDATLLFCADHMLRADWFSEDLRADRLVMLGPFAKDDARTTSRRLRSFVAKRPTVLLPAHDADAPRRLEVREVTAP